ncbi:hypothetical protein [Prevotella fusca]
MNRGKMNRCIVLLSMTCRFRAIVRKYNAWKQPGIQCYIIGDTMDDLFRQERESLLIITVRKRILSIIERLLGVLPEHLMIDIFGTMANITGTTRTRRRR